MNRKVYLIMYMTIALVVMSFVACGGGSERSNNVQVNVQSTVVNASDGLDLQSVGELAGKAKDAEALEELLNQKGSVNNLDLDEDDKVDYIKVTSDDQGEIRVLVLTAVLSTSGEEQDVATIEIEKTSSGETDVQLHGNEQIYGDNHYHRNHYGVGDYLMARWLYGPRYRPYLSPFGFGYYPGYYGLGYSRVSMGVYSTRTSSMTRGSSYTRSSSNKMSKNVSASRRSSGSAKSSAKVKAPLSKPTASQKSFQARNPSKTVGKGGFGKGKTTAGAKSTSTKSKSSTPRSSTRSASRSKSGGK
jgi:hypothetical protein